MIKYIYSSTSDLQQDIFSINSMYNNAYGLYNQVGQMNPQPMSNPSNNLFGNPNNMGQRSASSSVYNNRDITLTCLTCNTQSVASNSYECTNCREAKKREITQNRDQLLDKYKKEIQNKKSLTEQIQKMEKEVQTIAEELTSAGEKHEQELSQRNQKIKTLQKKLDEKEKQIVMLELKVKQKNQNAALKIQKQHRFLKDELKEEWTILHQEAQKLMKFVEEIAQKMPAKGKQSHKLLSNLQSKLIKGIKEQLYLLPQTIDKLIEETEFEKKRELDYLKQTEVQFVDWLQKRKKSFQEVNLKLQEQTLKAMIQPIQDNIKKVEVFLEQIKKMREKGSRLFDGLKKETEEIEQITVVEKQITKKEDQIETIQMQESEQNLI